jgi:hypothetical protein
LLYEIRVITFEEYNCIPIPNKIDGVFIGGSAFSISAELIAFVLINGASIGTTMKDP